MVKNILLSFLCATVLCPNSTSASKVRSVRTAYTLTKSLKISDLKESAAIIFRGSFEDFRYHEKNGLAARSLKFKVKEVIRGLDPETKKLVLTEWAQTRSPFTEELIASDQEYVFFFHEPSDRGFTSLLGMEQGMISINTDKSLGFSSKLSETRAKKRKLLFFTVEEELESYQDLKKYLRS